jgi:hypothetical protein
VSTRYPNPFCAARFAPGVLPWIGDLDPLVARACVPGARLQILGPHGSGKSTLLVHLARNAKLRGWNTLSLRGSHGLSALFSAERASGKPLVVFADEAEELGAARLTLVRAWCRMHRASLVVTAHRDLGLETLCERAVDAPLVRRLVDDLLDGHPPITVEVDDLLRRHHGNLREIFFDLYDTAAAR